MQDLLSVSIDRIRNISAGCIKYEKDTEGLRTFKDASVGYLDFLREQGTLTPTVEGWCAYIGISRTTLMKYEQRSEEWSDFIGYYKNILMAAKTELATKGKLPPIIYVFDATNNGSHYFNTSEFKISQKMPEVEPLTMKESPESIASRYRALLADSTEIDKDTETAESVHI